MVSSGEFITFLDDDNLRLPGSLDAQASALASAPKAGFVYGQTVLGDQDCVPTGQIYPEPCPQGGHLRGTVGTKFYRLPGSDITT